MGVKLHTAEEKKIYIVLSMSGTGFSKFLRLMTQKPYTHVSVSLIENIDIMYSFGRRSMIFPIKSGFIYETFNKGVIKVNKAICLNCGKEFPKYASSAGKYCSNKCQLEYQHKQAYELIINGDKSIMRANYSPSHFRDDIIKKQGGVCAICGMKPEWNDKPLVLIVDHIDGNAANNKRDNLRCICPNCDSQLDTYKSKNKNGARSYYRYHKYDEETKIGN